VPKAAVQLVDGVRCGDPDDPHAVIDCGEPSRIETVAGRPARVAAGAWQVFGCTLFVAHPDKPHLVVIGWPDDAPRRVHFRIRAAKGGNSPLRAGLNSMYSQQWKVNANGWTRSWTPLFIPGGTGREVNILFADSRRSRGLAPNHQGPRELAPWAVGEVPLYEVTDPAAALPPLVIAHPVPPGKERYFGFTGLGYAEGYLHDQGNKEYLKLYLRHLGVNFLRTAGGQGGPPYGQPQFENHLALLDEMGLRTSFVFLRSGKDDPKKLAHLGHAGRLDGCHATARPGRGSG